MRDTNEMRGSIAVGGPDLKIIVSFLAAWPTSERTKVYLPGKDVKF